MTGSSTQRPGRTPSRRSFDWSRSSIPSLRTGRSNRMSHVGRGYTPRPPGPGPRYTAGKRRGNPGARTSTHPHPPTSLPLQQTEQKQGRRRRPWAKRRRHRSTASTRTPHPSEDGEERGVPYSHNTGRLLRLVGQHGETNPNCTVGTRTPSPAEKTRSTSLPRPRGPTEAKRIDALAGEETGFGTAALSASQYCRR